MITQENLRGLLLELGFRKEKSIFLKHFNQLDCFLKIDFDNKEIIYPTDKGLIVNERQTCNFRANENFVVFECVHRLLEKGYKPEHIELEPKWKLGHGASGGRADILVKDNTGKSKLIIECKTDGREFNDAWKETLNGTTQLFTYAQQVKSTEFLCLYSSDFVVGNISYKNYIITLRDNEQLLEEYKDREPLSYKSAQEVEDIFKTWKETYAQDFSSRGIFEDDIPAYYIGKKKFTIHDLDSISSKDIQGKYHEFATILRQHNVSGRENAFDKLVNLFLCKIVDETRNPEELKFYWKGISYDSFFELQDRLQQLYQAGMKEFLGEEVTYIDNKAIDEAFRFFYNDPDATRDTIKNYFRQLKFFTNNDFAFIDVHNEKLFYQNANVLLKIVQMLQDIRLKTNEQNQFLGDMFEGFLDQGVKQSEGQYFTPMPIVKFILMSLPLENIITEAKEIPKVIDYACGAGHFLNEYAGQIKAYVEDKDELNSYYHEIVGVEKEYRLSKVAKVSAFMYGQDDIKIIYSDALAENHELKNGQYSIVVANPPYSVKGFLETLKERDKKRYDLINTIEEKSLSNNNSIEAFFIERAKQLLKPGGLAAIIVPSSILNKGSQKNSSKKQNVYVATREILLKYFDIISIVEFGSGTFGKTGTNTVTLFLRRKADDPAPSEHYKNRVEAWFKGDTSKDEVFDDKLLIEKYCSHIDIAFEDYKTLFNRFPNENLLSTDMFKEYRKDFDASSDIRALKTKKNFKNISKEEQVAELKKRFVTYLYHIEKEKLYYFILASLNPQEVMVVRSPSDNSNKKKFLGYEWSSAKGNEGIKYLGGSVISVTDLVKAEDEGETALDEEDARVLSNMLNLDNIKTPMYDPQNVYNNDKINFHILSNFLAKSIEIPESLKEYLTTVRLIDMLDFSRKDFNKSFNLMPKKNNNIKSKWQLVKLADIAEIKNGGTPDTNNPSYWDNGAIRWATLVDTKQKYLLDTERKITDEGLKNSSAQLLPINTVIFSSRATIGEVCINKVPIATNQGYKNFICDAEKINYEYLYYILMYFSKDIENMLPYGTKYKEINTETIKNYKIPLPPKYVQEQIVQECMVVDAEYNQAINIINHVNKKIAEKIEEIYNSKYDFMEIEKISDDIQYGISKALNTHGNGYKIFRMNEIIDKSMFDNGSMKYVDVTEEEFQRYKLNKGDILFNRTNSIEHVGKTGVYLLEGAYCFASYLIRVVVNRKITNPYFVNVMMNSSFFQEEAKSKASKSINQANINATIMKNIKIPIPPLNVQEEILQEIEILESKRKEAQVLINNIVKRKQDIFINYL